MRIQLIIYYLLFSAGFYCFGQNSIIVQGYLNEKDSDQRSKNTAAMYVLVKMKTGKTVYQSTFINKKGFFEFYKPCSSKNYNIEFYYLGHRMKPVIQMRELKKNKVTLNYRFNLNHFADSIENRKGFELPHCISYSYCGNNIYSDLKLFKLSMKYGVRYENMGCYYFDEKEANKEAIKKLNKSLGDNWDQVFMKETDSKLGNP